MVVLNVKGVKQGGVRLPDLSWPVLDFNHCQACDTAPVRLQSWDTMYLAPLQDSKPNL